MSEAQAGIRDAPAFAARREAPADPPAEAPEDQTEAAIRRMVEAAYS